MNYWVSHTNIQNIIIMNYFFNYFLIIFISTHSIVSAPCSFQNFAMSSLLLSNIIIMNYFLIFILGPSWIIFTGGAWSKGIRHLICSLFGPWYWPITDALNLPQVEHILSQAQITKTAARTGEFDDPRYYAIWCEL